MSKCSYGRFTDQSVRIQLDERGPTLISEILAGGEFKHEADRRLNAHSC